MWWCFANRRCAHAVTDLGTLWRNETGVPVRVFTSPTWALLEQISHRARSDLVIGEGDAAAAKATERHLVRPETLQPLWRNQLVVAATVTNIALSSSAPHLAALAGKMPIAIVDPSTAVAGAEGRKALEALGLWDAVSARSIGVVDTADASYLLTEGKVQLALLYATDVAADPLLALPTDFLPRATDRSSTGSPRRITRLAPMRKSSWPFYASLGPRSGLEPMAWRCRRERSFRRAASSAEPAHHALGERAGDPSHDRQRLAHL